MSKLIDRYNLFGAAAQRIREDATGTRRDIAIHGGIALFSLALTAASIYGAVVAPDIADRAAAISVGTLFGIGTTYETANVVANIAIRRS